MFVYDAGGQLIEEYSGSSLQTTYVYAGSRLLSTETATSTSYLTNDHLGSPRINTNTSGTVTARHDYHPFGEEIARTGYGSDTVRKQFTAYERDNESSLDFAQARYHNSNLGRFTSPDPAKMTAARMVDPQHWNLYVYARNNPLALIDITGEFPFTVYVRAFAPFKWFGPGGLWAGDNRSFSTDPNASSRLVGISEVETGGNGKYPMTFTRSRNTTSDFWGFGPTTSEGYVNDAFGNYSPDGVFTGHSRSLDYHLYGNNDAIPPFFTDTVPTWDIDIHSSFKFTTDPMANGDTALTISMSVKGDQFPAAESFVRDAKGNSVMLGVFAPTAGKTTGPVATLAGDKRAPMINATVTVVVSRSGIFQGVLAKGKVISLAEHNKRASCLNKESFECN